jgi:hypothetical protein
VLLCKGRSGKWHDHPDVDIWAGGNEWSVDAECSLLVLPLGTAPGDVKEDFLVFRGLSSESAAGCFALSPQERITPIVCVESSREDHADCFALSPQERITPIVALNPQERITPMVCVESSREDHAGCFGLRSQARGGSMVGSGIR